MPIINVKHASPLTDAQLEKLAATLTDSYCAATQAKPESVHVLIEQVSPNRWSVGGRPLARRDEDEPRDPSRNPAGKGSHA